MLSHLYAISKPLVNLLLKRQERWSDFLRKSERDNIEQHISRGDQCIAFIGGAFSRYNTSSISYCARHKKCHRNSPVTESPTAAHNNHILLWEPILESTDYVINVFSYVVLYFT